MEGRGHLSLNAALNLIYPDPSSGLIGEESKEKQRGKKALEQILHVKSLSTDSNDVAEAAEAAYYLGLFVLQEHPFRITKQKPIGIKENLSNFIARLSGGKVGSFSLDDPYEEAIKRFKQAIDLSGDFLYGDALFLLALLYKRQNKNNLSNAYLLWAAYSGNAKAQEAWIEEVKGTPLEELKSVPVSSSDSEKKKNVDASPPLRQLISSIRPKQRFYLAVRRMIAHTRTIAHFKSSRLNEALRGILEETGSIQAPNQVFNERVNAVEDAFDKAIKEKLIELSPPLPRSRKKRGMLVPNPVNGSYLKDILEKSTTKGDQKPLHAVLEDESDVQEIAKTMGKIGVKFYYLAAWWLKSCTEVELLNPVSPPQASVGRTEREKKLHGKLTLTEVEALELCRRGEKYYREGIRSELKQKGSGINKISAAVNCFKAAADAKCRDAVFNLGVVYENAWLLLDKPEDDLNFLESATNYYGKASDMGCAEASYALSEIYGSHFQRIKKVRFATAAYNYAEKARAQGYIGSGSGALQLVLANHKIISQQEKEKKEKKEEERPKITKVASSPPCPLLQANPNSEELARLRVKNEGEDSITDGKQQAEDEGSLSFFPLERHHIVNQRVATNKDEEELVLSLFASRPVGIFSGWSTDQKEQKYVKLRDYICHAQGSSCFSSGNSSYQSIQSLFQKLGISTDIRKKEHEELPDATAVAGELLGKWFAKKQEIKEVNADEKKVVEEIFNKRTSSCGISGWSKSNKKYATLESYIAYARRGAGLYSGSRSYQALNAFIEEKELASVSDIRDKDNLKTDKQIAEDILMELSNRRSLSKK